MRVLSMSIATTFATTMMTYAAVGLGPFAGVMAIFVHNLGVFEALLQGRRINHASCKTSYSAAYPG
jgi:ABC-type phosphate/phosphonate transport system permease subunit